MTDNIVAALLIGAAIVLGALALGGRYTITWTPISLQPDKLPQPKAKGG